MLKQQGPKACEYVMLCLKIWEERSKRLILEIPQGSFSPIFLRNLVEYLEKGNAKGFRLQFVMFCWSIIVDGGRDPTRRVMEIIQINSLTYYFHRFRHKHLGITILFCVTNFS